MLEGIVKDQKLALGPEPRPPGDVDVRARRDDEAEVNAEPGVTRVGVRGDGGPRLDEGGIMIFKNDLSIF